MGSVSLQLKGTILKATSTDDLDTESGGRELLVSNRQESFGAEKYIFSEI